MKAESSRGWPGTTLRCMAFPLSFFFCSFITSPFSSPSFLVFSFVCLSFLSFFFLSLFPSLTSPFFGSGTLG